MFPKYIRSFKINPVQRIFLGIFVISILFISLLYFLFKVREVRDISSSGESINIFVPNDVYDSILFITDLTKIKAKISISNPKLEINNLKWQIPGTLIVEAVKLKPIAFIRVGDRFMSVSESGQILEWTDSEPEGLGEVVVEDSLSIRMNQELGKLGDFDMGISLGVANVFQSNSISAFRIVIFDDEYIEAVLPASETTVRISSKGDRKTTLSRLDGFLKRLYTNGRSIRILDLRFEKPVIEVN